MVTPRASRLYRIRQNSRRETGSTPVVGSSSSSSSGSVDQRAGQRQLLLHPAGEELRQPVREGLQPAEGQQLLRALLPHSRLGTWYRSAKKRRFSITVRSPYREKRCGM